MVAMVGLVALLAGCADDPAPTPAGPMVLRAEGVARFAPAGDAPVAELVDGITAFGQRLAPADATDNWVASPTSIAFALAMIRAGAGGATATEIDTTFGFPARVHEAFNSLSRQLVTAEVPPARPKDEPTRAPGAPPRPTTVCIGNALFPAQGFEISAPYLRTLAEQYGAGVYPVDFHQPTATRDINDWAKHQTADRIQKVFESLDPDTALVLANTVYFKGEWVAPFDRARTGDAPFRTASGQVTVPTMRAETRVGYAAGEGWQAIELPYGDGTFALRVLLPTGAAAPRDLLVPAILGADMAEELVEVALPRWDFAADIKLKDELVRLGLPSLFDPVTADLSGISPVDLYAAQAVHRATITVDEFGSEAAAVTALALAPTSAPPAPTVTFTADHPFAFAIIHTPTGAPLFLGQVANPTRH